MRYFSSGCHTPQRRYKRQQVHRINSSFRFGAEPVVHHYCSLLRCCRERVQVLRRQQRRSRSRGFNKVPADSYTRSVRWPAPLRASALKEQYGRSRLFKDVITGAFLGVVVSWRLRTVTIAALIVWAFSTLRKLSWMVHVLPVEVCTGFKLKPEPCPYSRSSDPTQPDLNGTVKFRARTRPEPEIVFPPQRIAN